MKWAMVWGVNGGIGRAVAKQLHDTGWHVIGVAHRYAANENLSAPLLTGVWIARTLVPMVFSFESVWM